MRTSFDAAEVKARSSLISLAGKVLDLRREANRWKAVCPFHEERTASLVFFEPPDEHYHCFGCGAHGDIFQLVLGMGLAHSFPEAVDYVAGDMHMTDYKTYRRTQPKPAFDSRMPVSRILGAAWPAWGKPAESYLRSRGVWPPAIASELQSEDVLWINGECGLTYPAEGRMGKSTRFVPRAFCGACLFVYSEPGNSGTKIGVEVEMLEGDLEEPQLPTPRSRKHHGKKSGAVFRAIPDAISEGALHISEGPLDALAIPWLEADIGGSWSTGGTANMASLVVPLGWKRVVVHADGNPQGLEAAKALAERNRYSDVLIKQYPEGHDPCSVLASYTLRDGEPSLKGWIDVL